MFLFGKNQSRTQASLDSVAHSFKFLLYFLELTKINYLLKFICFGQFEIVS